MTPTRRHVVAGIGLSAVMPTLGHAATRDDTAIQLALDDALVLPPDRALTRLVHVEGAGASSKARLDLGAAKAGLKIDVELASSSLSAADRFSLRLRRAAGDDARLENVALDLEHAHATLAARAAGLFDALGIPGATIGARFEALWRDPRYLYSDDDRGRAAAVADMQATLAAIRLRMPTLFGALPPECLDVDIRALDAAEIADGKRGYRILPSPGIRGTYVVDLKAIRRRPRFSLPSAVAHELLPGHMIQMPLEARAAPHPLRLRYAAAFTEGWGIYAEMLMDWDGFFDTPADQLGHLHWMLFRVCRGLIDIAMHTRGLSQAKARELFLRWQGEPAYFANFENDIDRIREKPAMVAAEVWLAFYLTRRRQQNIGEWPVFHSNIISSGRRRSEQFNR